MGLFFWRQNRKIDSFARSLADDFFSHVHADAAKAYLDQGPQKSTKKVDRKLQDAVTRVRQFKAVNSLGVYGKARLHLSFIERLTELGYEQTLAERVNEKILLRSP